MAILDRRKNRFVEDQDTRVSVGIDFPFGRVGGGEGYFTTAKQFSDWVLNTADGAYYQPLAVPSTLTFAADSKTYKYTIEWDQSNTRWLAYEVHGEVGAYYRSRVNNNDVDDLTEEAISSPTSAQLAAKVWNTSSSAWE